MLRSSSHPPRVERGSRLRRRLRRAGIVAAVTLAILLIALTAGLLVIAPRVVATPNQGKTLDQLGDLGPAELARLGVDRQLRVQVGPPTASLSLWVIEPFRRGLTVRIPEDKSSALAWEFDQSDRVRLASNKPLGTILVLHGIYDSKEKFGGFWGWVFAAAGYRTVVVDLRGHGRSTGDYMTYGVVESRDLTQVIDALEREGLVTGRLGVFGVSYGGAVAIQASAIDPRIEAVATVGAFSSLREVAYPFGRQLVTRRLGWAAWTGMRKLVPAALAVAGRTAGFDPARADTCDAMARGGAPVLLVHGDADRYVPRREAEALHDANPERSELALVPGAGHVSLVLGHVGEIRALALPWFDHYLAGRPRPGLGHTRVAAAEGIRGRG